MIAMMPSSLPVQESALPMRYVLPLAASFANASQILNAGSQKTGIAQAIASIRLKSAKSIPMRNAIAPPNRFKYYVANNIIMCWV
jgi:hypothetical protein